MNASRSFVDDGIINYTLSLAAVKSGYMTAVPTMISEGESEVSEAGYEVEAKQDKEVDDESAATISIRLTRTQGSDEASKESEVETELVEVRSKYTDATPPRPHGASAKAFKSAKKKMTRLFGKVKKKGSALSVAASTKSKSFRSITFRRHSGATFSAANSSGISTFGEDSVEQEERKRVLIEPVLAAEKDYAADHTILSIEAIPTSPTERTSSDIAVKTANKEDSFSCSSTHVSKEEKKSRLEPQEEAAQVESPMRKEEQHEVPQNYASETSGETDDHDESVIDDDDHTETETIDYDDHTEAIDDDDYTDANTLNFMKVSKRTYVMSESESIVGESWSKEEKAQGGGGLFGCGMCTPREEWDDDFDNLTVQTGSEEGRVADAVITIQEHAHRLGISEQELLEMIQDH